MWGIARSTVYAQKQVAAINTVPAKRGRKPDTSDDQLLKNIRCILSERSTLGFTGEGYRKVWAQLRLMGIRVDKERVRLMMGKHELLAPCRQSVCRGPKAHTGTIIPLSPNLMWGTDATSTITSEHGKVTVFAAVDHFSGECIGIHAAIIGNRFEALEPLMQGIAEYFGGYFKNTALGLKIRHDHGSQYMSRDFQKEVKFLGATSSPSFVRSPEGNGVIERFFKTLKEQLLWARCFRNIDELLVALHKFKDLYNNYWMLQRHNYKSPAQVRNDWRRDSMQTVA